MNSPSASSQRRSDRLVALLALLEERGYMPLSQLATELGASNATIRRDVAALARQGLLTRTHGGARPREVHGELPVELRDGRNHAVKLRIANAAAQQIPPGRHAIGLTGGTTTAEVLRALRHRDDLTIITNSLSIGLEAAEQRQGRVLIAGGVLRSNSLELVGPLTESTLKLVNVATAIIGADGVSVSGGLTTHDEVEARTNHTLVEHAQRVIAVVDSTKLGRKTLAKLADLSEIDLLITDSRASQDILDDFRAVGVQVHIVPAPKGTPD
ncbi:MAG: DeoR/GlpR family DNA-binding transcription regulator [Arachnia sp.]